MAIQDKIAADKDAVVAAQVALDSAKAQLAADEATAASIQPHLDILAEIEAKLVAADDVMDQAMRDALLTVEAMIKPLIAKMRDIFNQV